MEVRFFMVSVSLTSYTRPSLQVSWLVTKHRRYRRLFVSYVLTHQINSSFWNVCKRNINRVRCGCWTWAFLLYVNSSYSSAENNEMLTLPPPTPPPLEIYDNFQIIAILFVAMAYRASNLRGLGIAHMVFGALMIIFGIASIIAVDGWSSRIGFGIWVGIWVSV